MAQIQEAGNQVRGKIKGKAQSMDIFQKLLNKCEICGKEFEVEPYPYSLRYSKVTCSTECLKIKTRKWREKNINLLMARADIPLLFRTLTSDKNIDFYIKSEKGVYIWGNKSGPGKTVMACTIGRELILEGREVQYISSPKFIVQLQSAYKKSKAIDEMLDKVAEVEILIIDDIGAEKLTDFVRQTFYYLINEREQWMRKTIITSNYSLDELDQYIDKRISSRIAGICSVVELVGKDRRIKDAR